MYKNKIEYLECFCSSKDHIVCVHVYEYTKGEVFLYISTQMAQGLSFWQRLKSCFKYLFGLGNCNYGHCTETMVEKDQAKKLKEIIDYFLDD